MTASRISVLKQSIDALTMAEAVEAVEGFSASGSAGYVCFCNAHSLATSLDDPNLAHSLAEANYLFPDGAPVAWMLRYRGASGQQRVSGPDFMQAYLTKAASRSEAIFLLGGAPETLSSLEREISRRFTGIRIAGAYAPAFRVPTPHERDALVRRINESGARSVWVGLGCPKQELWMHANSKALNAVLLGVGAAFDFLAGSRRRAPAWLQSIGLEWLHRLVHEPWRLGPRYLRTNLRFVTAVISDMVDSRFRRQ